MLSGEDTGRGGNLFRGKGVFGFRHLVRVVSTQHSASQHSARLEQEAGQTFGRTAFAPQAFVDTRLAALETDQPRLYPTTH